MTLRVKPIISAALLTWKPLRLRYFFERLCSSAYLVTVSVEEGEGSETSPCLMGVAEGEAVAKW